MDTGNNQALELEPDNLTGLQEQLIAAIQGLDSKPGRRLEVAELIRSLKSIVQSTLLCVEWANLRQESDLAFIGEPEGPQQRPVTNSDAIVYLRKLRDELARAVDRSKEAPRDGFELMIDKGHPVNRRAAREDIFGSRVQRLRRAIDTFLGK